MYRVYIKGFLAARAALLQLCPDQIWRSRISCIYDINMVTYDGDVATDNVWATSDKPLWWFIGFFNEVPTLDKSYEVRVENEG